MTAAVIDLETEDFARAASDLVHRAADPSDVALRRAWHRLEGCAGMAGSDPGGRAWAASYDRAATAAMNAGLAASQGTVQLARTFARTAHNYAAADAASSPAGRAAIVPAATPGGDVWLPGCVLPSAVGSSGGGPPGWHLIADVVGYVWPNGHQDRLRRAASAWRESAAGLRAAGQVVADAPLFLIAHRLPEADDAWTVCSTAARHLEDLAGVHDGLAASCDALARHLDEAHAAAVGELRSLVEWTAGIEVGGALLSIVSFGAAEVPTQAAEAARVARTAAVVGRGIERFLVAARSLADAAAAAGERAQVTGARLHALLDVPLAEPALAGVAPLRMLQEARQVRAAVRLERDADAPILSAAEEAGGHTLARHVGLTDEELVARKLPLTSTFTDLDAAEEATARNVAEHQAELQAWAAGGERKLEIHADVAPSAGLVYDGTAGTFRTARKVCTVFVKRKGKIILLTSYLLP